MPELAHFPAYVRTGCVRTYAAIDPKHAYRRDKRKRQGTTAMVIPCLCSFLLTVLSSASAGTCRGEAPPSCCARPFCRLKAPLGLSLLRCAAQTRTFENTLISAACKKKKGELWQKERGLDGASPLDNFFKSETGYRTILSNRFCKRSNVSSSTVRKVRSDRKFKR